MRVVQVVVGRGLAKRARKVWFWEVARLWAGDGHPEVIHLAAIAHGGNGTAAIRGIALTLGKANVTLAVRFRNACAPST